MYRIKPGRKFQAVTSAKMFAYFATFLSSSADCGPGAFFCGLHTAGCRLISIPVPVFLFHQESAPYLLLKSLPLQVVGHW